MSTEEEENNAHPSEPTMVRVREYNIITRDDLYKDRNESNVTQSRQQEQNHIEKQLNNALQKPVDKGPGHSMMQRMGWTGGGLGKSGEGIVEPIAPNASYVSGQSRNYGTGNLSGSAKRRFRRMCKANIPPEKAIHLCRKTLKELVEEVRKIDEENSRLPKESSNWSTQRYGPYVGPSSTGLIGSEEGTSQRYGLTQNYPRSEGDSRDGLDNGSYNKALQNYVLSQSFDPLESDYSEDQTTNEQTYRFTSSRKQDNYNEQRSEHSQCPIRVGIYNYKMMNDDQKKIIHRALNQKILKIGAKGVGPRFLSLDYKEGWIQIICEDELSRDWLFDEVPKLRPWPDARLHIRTEKDLLDNLLIVTAYIPLYEVQSIDEALNLLAVQNEGLNTESWQVYDGKQVENGLAVAFSIDSRSLETLKANNLKAVLGFKTVHFKINIDPHAVSLDNNDMDSNNPGFHNPICSSGRESPKDVYRERPEPFIRNSVDSLRDQTRPFYQGPIESPKSYETEPYFENSFERLERDRSEDLSRNSFQSPHRDRNERYSDSYNAYSERDRIGNCSWSSFEPPTRDRNERYSGHYEYPDRFSDYSLRSPKRDRKRYSDDYEYSKRDRNESFSRGSFEREKEEKIRSRRDRDRSLSRDFKRRVEDERTFTRSPKMFRRTRSPKRDRSGPRRRRGHFKEYPRSRPNWSN